VRGRATSTLPLVALGVAVAWSMWLYSPWDQQYLDRADFNEFLPLLRRGRNSFESFWLVSDYYWLQGRFIPLTIAYTAAKWSAFGTWARGWQLATQTLMLANVVLTYRVARRLGASQAGSCAGSALMIAGTSAVEAWCRVHLSESEGLFFFLAAVYFAAGPGHERSEGRKWIALPLFVCAVLTKETFVVIAPFVLLVGLAYEGNGNWAVPRLGARQAKWALLIASGAIVAITPALIARLTSLPASYGARYGSSHLSTLPFGTLIHTRFFAIANPFNDPLPDTLILAVIATGWIVGIRRRIAGTNWVVEAAVLLSLPIAGAIAYLPWPQWSLFYGLPFGLALAVLLARAATFLLASSSAALRAATVATLFACGILLTARAKHQSGDIYARRQVVGATIAALSTYLRKDKPTQILVPENYPGAAETLERYARATHDIQFPPFHAVPCASAPGLGQKSDISSVILRFSYLCSDNLAAPGRRIYATSVAYRWVDFGERALRSSRYSGALFLVSRSPYTSPPLVP
jgi:hypothetical protein